MIIKWEYKKVESSALNFFIFFEIIAMVVYNDLNGEFR